MNDLYGGLDLGTTFSKLHTGEIFASGISEKVYDMAQNVMTVDGKRYTMELFSENASYDMNSNKALNRNIKLNFLYSLHKLADKDMGIFKDVLVNLPAKQWENESSVKMYKKLLEFDNSVFVDVNGEQKELYVDSIGVVPEDFPAYFTEEVNNARFNKRKVLLIGIGSFNSNQYLIKNDEIEESDSNEMGCLRIFQKVASAINSVHNTNVKKEGVYDVMQNGLFKDGEVIDITSIANEIIYPECEKFAQEMKLRWSINNISNVICVGGGSIVLKPYLCKYIPHLELINNAQNVAAKGMKYMLELMAS
jgi:hypothetical protein